jgi:hypothetical protein
MKFKFGMIICKAHIKEVLNIEFCFYIQNLLKEII